MNVFADWPKEKLEKLLSDAHKMRFLGASIDQLDREDLYVALALVADEALDDKETARSALEKFTALAEKLMAA